MVSTKCIQWNTWSQQNASVQACISVDLRLHNHKTAAKHVTTRWLGSRQHNIHASLHGTFLCKNLHIMPCIHTQKHKYITGSWNQPLFAVLHALLSAASASDAVKAAGGGVSSSAAFSMSHLFGDSDAASIEQMASTAFIPLALCPKLFRSWWLLIWLYVSVLASGFCAAAAASANALSGKLRRICLSVGHAGLCVMMALS